MESQNELVKKYFEHFNAHRWKEMSEMYAEKADFKDPSLGSGIISQTPQQIEEKYTELHSVFSDLLDEVVQLYPSGEQHVIAEFISKGTTEDGSVFELPICTIFTIENRQIVKDFTYYDNFDETNNSE